MQTSAPACASLIAVARPRPDAAPVTSAALPFISIAIDIVCSPAREGTHTHWKGRPLATRSACCSTALCSTDARGEPPWIAYCKTNSFISSPVALPLATAEWTCERRGTETGRAPCGGRECRYV